MSKVSTHSPRGGRTQIKKYRLSDWKSFNSLSPRGANRNIDKQIRDDIAFQLTRPAGANQHG